MKPQYMVYKTLEDHNILWFAVDNILPSEAFMVSNSTTGTFLYRIILISKNRRISFNNNQYAASRFLRLSEKTFLPATNPISAFFRRFSPIYSADKNVRLYFTLFYFLFASVYGIIFSKK